MCEAAISRDHTTTRHGIGGREAMGSLRIHIPGGHTIWMDCLSVWTRSQRELRWGAGHWHSSLHREGVHTPTRTHGFTLDRALGATEAAIHELRQLQTATG